MIGDKKFRKIDMEENMPQTYTIANGHKSLHLKDKLEMEGPLLLDPKLKTYGLLDSLKDTECFLLAHPEIIEGPTVLELLQWCNILKDDADTFNKVSRQCIYIIYLYDLSRQVNIEPVQCVSPFFDKIQEPSFRERFENEVLAYRSKLQALSFKELLNEVVICTSTSSSDNFGSSAGSSSSDEDCSIALDPLQVYNSLPPQIQQCLEDEDLVALEHELSQLPQKRAKDLFIRLLRSGLLLPVEKDQSLKDENTAGSSDIKFDSESSSSNDTALVNYLNDNIDFDKYASSLGDDSDSSCTTSLGLDRNKSAKLTVRTNDCP